MAITWITPQGSLGIVTERILLDIPIEVSSNNGPVTFSIIAGSLPVGVRLMTEVSQNGETYTTYLRGAPVEVRRFTDKRFVIRATDGETKEDRTFSISIDGSDEPFWITKEGFLNVGQGESYFVLDNARVDFQLEADDPDLTAGDSLEFYLSPMGGELPPGLTLTRDGRITGFTDPVYALEYNAGPTGAYDMQTFDIVPLDTFEARSNGFDTFFYDTVTFDYNEPSRVPKRISRFYTFVVSVTDGVNVVKRLFRIWVVTDEFLQADNSLVQVDTNLFRADSASNRVPLWITPSYLGKYRANNYVTLYLDVYDPPSLTGTIIYFLLPKNPDGTDSIIPPGLELDVLTGELAGRVPYQERITKNFKFTMQAVNFPASLATKEYTLVGDWSSRRVYVVGEAARYEGFIYIVLQESKGIIPDQNPTFWELGVSTSEKTFNVDIIGEIESGIEWRTAGDLGVIKPNIPSELSVEAISFFYGGRVFYELIGGALPPGLSFISNGVIQGKVKQFGDSSGPGITRFADRDSSLIDSTGTYTYNTTFDGTATTFDKLFKFQIKARDGLNVTESIKDFYVLVDADNQKTYANLYLKAFQDKQKRLQWFNFITDADIFRFEEIYRYSDENFGVQPELKVLVFAGIESVEAVRYVQAMSRNHYLKQIKFGEVRSAKAKDPDTQEVIYEVIYVTIEDELEKNGKSISSTVELSNTINSRVLVSQSAIRVDSDIPFASDRDHQRIFPNSIRNMRRRIRSVGERDRTFLPLWMRSVQDESFVETGYVKALILCYAKPGFSESIISRIKAKGFDFKGIDFTADRYLIDILDGEIENKYLAFPQRGEKLP